MEINYIEQAKAFSFGQAYGGGDYELNLEQLLKHSTRISWITKGGIDIQEAFDNLLVEVQKLQKQGYDPLTDLDNYL